MEKVLENIKNLEQISRKTYTAFIGPLYNQNKREQIQILNKVRNGLGLIAEHILDLIKKTNLQYARELNIDKLKIFHEDLLIQSNKIERQIFLDKNKKEIDSDLVNIKEQITNPEKYFRIEEDVKNLLNLFIDYLERVQTKIKHKYTNLYNSKKSSDELIKIVDQKDRKIIELNNQLKEYNWLESKEKAKSSKLSEMEDLLLKKTKAGEQNLTILKLHVIQVEKELNEMYRHIKSLNNDLKHLEARYIEKEQISLELIKELKDELLATRYALSKQK